MIKNSKEITNFIKLVNDRFGNLAPVVNNHWEGDLLAIGFQKANKLIYVAIYDQDKFFYECEIHLNDPNRPYITQDSENNVSSERVLEVMSKFFEIQGKKA